jgi:hypothetical protein
MALQKNYIVGNTGVEVPDAYHVIYNVYTERRLHDAKQPKIPGNKISLPDIKWKAGYIGRIAILVYASKEDRDTGKQAVGAIVKYQTDAADRNTGVVEPALYQITPPCELEFFIDTNSSDSILTQAYNYLKTIPYFSGSLEV